jgi:hypothetical protein
MQTVYTNVWKKGSREGSTMCSKLPLLELLHLASDFQVTDPRDRLYAVLGLSEEATSAREALPSLTPDYSRFVETT